MTSPAARPRALAWTAVILTALWSTPGAIDSFDAQARLRVAEQLVRERRLVVGAYPDSVQFSYFRDRAGLYPSYFGFGQSLFFVPFVAASDWAASHLGRPEPFTTKISRFIMAVSLFTVMLLANYWLCVAVARELKADAFASHLAGFIAVFGSSFWQMVKQEQEEVQLASLALLGLYGYLRWRRTGRGTFVWLSAAAAAIAIVFRPTAITFPLGLFALFAVGLGRRPGTGSPRRGAVASVARPFAVTAVVGLALIMAYNRFKTGSPLRAGYADSQFQFVPANAAHGFIGLTVGFDRGLVWHNLWLVPLALLMIRRWRRLSEGLRHATGFAGFLLAGSLALYCSWVTWAGDMTYGTRFQQHAIPLVAVVLVLGALEALRLTSVPARRGVALAALLLAAAQLPSLLFVHNLEILQGMAEGRPHALGHTNTEHGGGQLRLRLANVRSKIATGATVSLDTLDRATLPLVLGLNQSSADQSEREAAALTLLRKLARWDFWPWRIEDYVPAGGVSLARILWSLLLIASVAAWGSLLFGLSTRGHARTGVEDGRENHDKPSMVGGGG